MQYIITYFPEYKKHALKETAEVGGTHVFDIDKAWCVVAGNNFAEKLNKADPIFVRHIMPIQIEGETSGNKQTDCATVLAAAQSVFAPKKGERFSVQCRILNSPSSNFKIEYSARDVEIFVGTHFDRAGAVSVFSTSELLAGDEFTVVSIFVFDGKFFIGVSNVNDNLNAHCDEYRILSRTGREISRAENKLKEVIVKFGLELNGEGRALDIGASPGGWTKVLADYGYDVTAVDPGLLKECLYNHPKITHIKDRVENVTFEHEFDVVVNDMNIDPQTTAQIMCQIAKLMKPKGTAVVTLKLPFSDVWRGINGACGILKQEFAVKTIKNLSHNRREVTVLLEKLNQPTQSQS